MTDQAVHEAADRITAAIDHLIASVQDVAEAIREGSTKPYELPKALRKKPPPEPEPEYAAAPGGDEAEG